MSKQPPKVIQYRGATYRLREADYDEKPLSDEMPIEKGEKSKVQQAIKDSKNIYTLPREDAAKKVKHPSQIETGININEVGDGSGLASGLGGDGGDGGGGGNGGGGGE